MIETKKKLFLLFMAALCILAMPQSARANITDGLIAYWPFDEGSGSTAADISVNGNDGSINGAGWTTGKFGNALNFDGSNDYVDCGNDASLKPASAVTVSAWIKTDYYVYYGQIAGYATDTGANESGYSIITDDVGYLGAWLTGASGDGWYLWTLDVPAYPNVDWVHVVLTYDGTTSILYVNADPKATSNHSGNIDYDHVGNFLIGVYDDPIGSYWFPYAGLIDEVAVWDRALDQTEVTFLYNNPISSGGISAVIITETLDSTEVDEGGGTDSYDIVLYSSPASDVLITVTPGDSQIDIGSGPGVAKVLTFTPEADGDWDSPQTITVTAYDDTVFEPDDDPHTTVITQICQSTDSDYDDIPVKSVSVAVYDNDLGCGSWGYLDSDINHDCYVNLLDLKMLAEKWLFQQP